MKNKKFSDYESNNFFKLINFLYIFKDIKLSPEETKLLIFRFFNGKTYKECVELMGWDYSKQYVNQKVNTLLRKIKKQSKKENNLLKELYQYYY